MKALKALMVGLLLAVGLFTQSQAASVSGVWTAGNTNLVLGQGFLTSVTLVNTNDATTVVRLYDAPYVLTNVLAAYVSRSVSAASVITTNINFFGATNYWTNTVLSSTLTTNAASTNFYPILYQVLVNTNTTLEIDFSANPLRFQNGVNLSNAATLGVTATYLQ